MENYFKKNLLYLRKKKGENQSTIASTVNKGHTTIGNWEKGVSEPNISEIGILSHFFEISIDDLLYADLENVHLNKKTSQQKEGQNVHLNVHPTVHLKGRKGSKKGEKVYNLPNEPTVTYGARTPTVISTDNKGNENIVYVPVKARAGYLSGYGDSEYIETLPTFRLPGFNNASYRMFEVEGPSMAPTIQHGDRIIGEWVEGIDQIRDNRVHIIVHTNGIAVKRVLNRVQDRSKIYLKSDTLAHRAEFPTIDIDPSDIKEIWYGRIKLSADLSEPSDIYRRFNDMEVEILDLKASIQDVRAHLPQKKK